MNKNVKRLKTANRKTKTTGVKTEIVKDKIKPVKVKGRTKNDRKLKYEKWNVSPVVLDRAVDGIISLSMKLSKLRGKYVTNKTVDELEQTTLKIFKNLSIAVNPE